MTPLCPSGPPYPLYSSYSTKETRSAAAAARSSARVPGRGAALSVKTRTPKVRQSRRTDRMVIPTIRQPRRTSTASGAIPLYYPTITR